MRTFEHERTEVYAVALDFVKHLSVVRGQLPAVQADLGKRLDHAALAIVVNVAKAGGELPGADKARFFRIARRAAIQCAAILDVVCTTDSSRFDTLEESKARLRTIATMLIQMSEWADDFAPASYLQ